MLLLRRACSLLGHHARGCAVSKHSADSQLSVCRPAWSARRLAQASGTLQSGSAAVDVCGCQQANLSYAAACAKVVTLAAGKHFIALPPPSLCPIGSAAVSHHGDIKRESAHCMPLRRRQHLTFMPRKMAPVGTGSMCRCCARLPPAANHFGLLQSHAGPLHAGVQDPAGRRGGHLAAAGRMGVAGRPGCCQPVCAGDHGSKHPA